MALSVFRIVFEIESAEPLSQPQTRFSQIRWQEYVPTVIFQQEQISAPGCGGGGWDGGGGSATITTIPTHPHESIEKNHQENTVH